MWVVGAFAAFILVTENRLWSFRHNQCYFAITGMVHICYWCLKICFSCYGKGKRIMYGVCLCCNCFSKFFRNEALLLSAGKKSLFPLKYMFLFLKYFSVTVSVSVSVCPPLPLSLLYISRCLLFFLFCPTSACFGSEIICISLILMWGSQIRHIIFEGLTVLKQKTITLFNEQFTFISSQQPSDQFRGHWFLIHQVLSAFSTCQWVFCAAAVGSAFCYSVNWLKAGRGDESVNCFRRLLLLAPPCPGVWLDKALDSELEHGFRFSQ